MENVEPPGTVVTPLRPARWWLCPTPSGRFRVWIRGASGGRPSAYIDGRKVGDADEINTPGQWEQIAEIDLITGHAPDQARASGSLGGTGRRVARRARSGGPRARRAIATDHGLARAGDPPLWARLGLDRVGAAMTEPAEGAAPPGRPASACARAPARGTGARRAPRALPGSRPARPEPARARRCCGEGYGTALLAAAGARSAAGSISTSSTVAHARGRHPGAEFVRADVGSCPSRTAAFDLVVSFETIEHVADPERVLDELERVLDRRRAADGLYPQQAPVPGRQRVPRARVLPRGIRGPTGGALSQRRGAAPAQLAHVGRSARAGAADHRARGPRTRVPQGCRGGAGRRALHGRAVRLGELPRLRGAAVAAGVDEAHELARRLVEADARLRGWHQEYEAAKHVAETWHAEYQTVVSVYSSVWWRLTAPLRWLADLIRRARWPIPSPSRFPCFNGGRLLGGA